MFKQLINRVTRWIRRLAQKNRTNLRMYAAAKVSRLTTGWNASNTSADTELSSSLRTMRARSRALIRDAAYAKRAKIIVVNNVVGWGIGMQAQIKAGRGELNTRINDAIEAAWKKWAEADSCHTGGKLHFSDFERAAISQIFEAGEVFIRKHYRPFGNSSVPFALELIEAERLADDFQPSAVQPDARVRMGIEADRFHRPVAYWIRELHPGELHLTAEQTDRLERVPADQIIHLHLVERWPQTRGEPWLHAAARRLNDMDGYSEAEIVGARAAASYMGFIESPESSSGLVSEEMADGSRQTELEPGIIDRLLPGEKFNFANPNRPNSQFDPFMRMMLREAAAGVGTSYESLSRDYSQSNYSSSRLALLDDRDLWRVLQLWFIRAFRAQIHREWLQQAVLTRTIPEIGIEAYAASPEKYEAVRFKPRGWSWIDPTKEVEAYKEAVRGGFITVSEVIALTGGGRDIEDVLNERADELKMMKAKGLKFDTEIQDPAPAKDAAPPAPNGNGKQPADDQDDDPVDRFLAEFHHRGG